MELCSNGHDEVCYDSRNCPVCAMIDDLEDQIRELQEKIDDLEATNE